MDENLSLDEIIELRRRRDPDFARDGLDKSINFVDRRTGSYQRTPRKRSDAPNTYNQGKSRPSSSSSSPPPSSPVRSSGSIRWQPAPQRQNYRWSRNPNVRNNTSAWNDDTPGFKRFVRRPHPRHYVDLDNMQELEDEQIIRALQAGGRKKRASSPAVIINLDPDDDWDMSRTPPPRTPPSKKARTDMDHGPRKILTSSDDNRRRESMTQLGFRLLISNLDPCVTTADIQEVFSDVGPMYAAKVIRPGTAEVVYKSLEDAKSAVSQYHRRELDGQPMHCELVTNQSSAVGVDVDVLHTVLFGQKKESRPLFSGRFKHRH